MRAALRLLSVKIDLGDLRRAFGRLRRLWRTPWVLEYPFGGYRSTKPQAATHPDASKKGLLCVIDRFWSNFASELKSEFIFRVESIFAEGS